MNKQRKDFVMIARKYIFLFVCLSISPLYGMNLLQPYNILIRPDYTANYRFQLGLYGETGISDRGYNSDGCSVNVLRIWNSDQDALAMLDGFPVDSPQGQKRAAVNANDDGTRGHFKLCGDLDLTFAGALSGRLFFRENWSLGLYFPFYAMKLKNVCLEDLTQDVTDEDVRVHELLTDNIVQNICELGDGLHIGGWNRVGPGDAALLLEWFHDFPQAKQLLKNARVNWRAGLTLPTGFRQDEDKLFAIPYGFDGAVGLPFGMGLDLTFAFYLRAGFEVTLTHVFGNTRERRIKTSIDQTDLFLLKKTKAFKDFGLTQQYDLYVQFYRFFSGFSAMLGYQYLKHGDDTLVLCGNDEVSDIANTAVYLKDWTLHEFYIRADYDIGHHLDDPKVYPRIAVYGRIPFNGKRSAANPAIGMTFSLDF